MKNSKKKNSTQTAKRHKTTQKTTGKSSSTAKNSVRKAVSTNQKSKTSSVAKKSDYDVKTGANEKEKEVINVHAGGLVEVTLKFHNDYGNTHYHIMVDENFDGKHSASANLSSKRTKGQHSKEKNYKVEHSPIKNGKPSYMRRKGTVDKTSSYYGKRSGEISETDWKHAQIAAERAKKTYKKK